jgi:hypothetical protein
LACAGWASRAARFEKEEEDKDDDDEYLIMSVMMSVCARLGRASLRIHDGRAYRYHPGSYHRNELSRLGMREVDIEGRFEEEEEDDHDECARKTRKSFVVH